MLDTTVGLVRLAELVPPPVKSGWRLPYYAAVGTVGGAWFLWRHKIVGAQFAAVCATRFWLGSWTTALLVVYGTGAVAIALVIGAARVSPEVHGALRQFYWRRKRRRLVDDRWPRAAAAAGLERRTPDGAVHPTVRVGYASRDLVKASVAGFGVVGKTADDLAAAADRVAAVYVARSCRVVVKETHAASLTLRWGADPLARTIPLNTLPAPTRKWHAVMGVTEDGGPVAVNVRRSVLLGGMSGSGKSNCVWALLAGLVTARIPVRLWVADPKGGMELGALEPVAWRYEKTTKDCTDMIMAAHKEMLAKAARQGKREHVPTEADPLDLLIVDETLALGKSTRNDTESSLAQIGIMGRAPGFAMWLCAQAGALQTLGNVRDFIPNRLCFAAERPEMTDAILGKGSESGGAPCSKISNEEQGIGFKWHEEVRGFVRFKVALVPESAVAGIVAGLAGIATVDVS